MTDWWLEIVCYRRRWLSIEKLHSASIAYGKAWVYITKADSEGFGVELTLWQNSVGWMLSHKHFGEDSGQGLCTTCLQLLCKQMLWLWPRGLEGLAGETHLC